MLETIQCMLETIQARMGKLANCDQIRAKRIHIVR